ncbi:TDT family transporter [Streptomyces sp. NPDC051776]|uniref:TDT family transporter n=1 Tax=Streptomyces sp. NPDC051776 TaxID=3155414 RepID=UPI003432ACC8
MTALAPPLSGRPPVSAPGPRTRPSPRELGPNWYATVMGTAVVATTAAGLPLGPAVQPWLRAAATVVWAVTALLLLGLLSASAAQWIRHPGRVRDRLLDPAVAPFYGCPAMAFPALGAATLGVGGDVIGGGAALVTAAVLFAAGTATGLVVATAIPYLMITRHRTGPGSATPVWLLPVVAPMVPAALGPQLVPHLPPGQAREALLLGCLSLFGMSLLATLLILPLVFARLVHDGPLPLALTPSLFLVLGPLGQSVTATGRLADAAPGAVAAPYAGALSAFGVLYGVPVLGFALLWLAVAAALTARAVRRGMPFGMTWWACTFPVGTCVTGSAVLARHTGLVAYGWLAVALFVLLVAAWGVAGFRTVRGVLRGELLAAPRRARPGPAPMTARTR